MNQSINECVPALPALSGKKKIKKSRRKVRTRSAISSSSEQECMQDEVINAKIKIQNQQLFEEKENEQKHGATVQGKKKRPYMRKQKNSMPMISEWIRPINDGIQAQIIKEAKPIIEANQYKVLNELDFDIFTSHLAKTKIYSVLLMDEFGRILYADKLAGEQYEGSLNKFQRIKLTDLILEKQRQSIIRKMSTFKKFTPSSIMKFIIYSKNTKRRYSKVALDSNSSPEDLFYRFLKCLTMRIRPIQVTFQDYERFQGFWNRSLVSNEKPIKCFLLETRLAIKTPQLQSFDLFNDCTIAKYIISNIKKLDKQSKGKKDAEMKRTNLQEKLSKNELVAQKVSVTPRKVPQEQFFFQDSELGDHPPKLKDQNLIRTSGRQLQEKEIISSEGEY